jgi:hypothetical protein
MLKRLVKSPLMCGIMAGIATLAVAVPRLLGLATGDAYFWEYLVWPGATLAWVIGGDNYSSAKEFEAYSVFYGVLSSVAAAFVLARLVKFAAGGLSRREHIERKK